MELCGNCLLKLGLNFSSLTGSYCKFKSTNNVWDSKHVHM